MPTQIFVNLPVADVKKSTDFYRGLGYELNPQFSDENASCIVISDSIFVMLLAKKFFDGFLTGGETSHIGGSTREVLNSIGLDSNEAVNSIAAEAVAVGGSVYRGPGADAPGMYGVSIADPDGHVWEYFHMDMAEFQQPVG